MFWGRNRYLFGKKVGAWEKGHKKPGKLERKKIKHIQLSSVIKQLKEASGVIFPKQIRSNLAFAQNWSLAFWSQVKQNVLILAGLKGQPASSQIRPFSPPAPLRTPWLFTPKALPPGDPGLSSCCLLCFDPRCQGGWSLHASLISPQMLPLQSNFL